MRISEIYQPIEEGPHDPHIFKAVFMAGAPGSGKSTVAAKIFGGSGLKSLNVDTFWQLYNATGRQGDYDKYWDLYKNQEKNYIDGRLGLLIDGTARNPEIMGQVKQRLESLGYDCAMIFVNTSLETSINRTVRRANSAGKDQGRHVDQEFVERTWQQVQNGLGRLQSLFGQQFFIVDNNRANLNVDYVEKALRRWMAQPPQRPIAKEWVKNSMAKRQGQNADAAE